MNAALILSPPEDPDPLDSVAVDPDDSVSVDPDPPEASSHSVPYGVVYLFTDAGTSTAERLRRRYDCELGTDSRPEYNPYGI